MMPLLFTLVFVLNMLSVQSRAQFRQGLDPSGAALAQLLGLDTLPNGDCICTPFYRCYDDDTSSNLNGLVGDRVTTIDGNPVILNHPVITVRQESEPAACPEFLDVCCRNLIPPSNPSQISPQIPENVDVGNGSTCGVRNSAGVGFTIEGFTEGQAQYGEFPWMVALLTSNTGFGSSQGVTNLYVGGGSLIDPLVVLTAAHKVFDNAANKSLIVRIGEWNFQTANEPTKHQNIRVRQVIYHPRFDRSNLVYNYALLVLEQPAELGDTVGTICLPSNSRQNFDGQQCILSGWGQDVYGEVGRYQRIPKLVSVNMVEHSQCQSAMKTAWLNRGLGSSFTLDRSFVCAGDQGQDACTGDGGSPLVCPDPTSPGQYVQVGISAWGIDCGQPGIPGVYSAIVPAVEWIQNTLKTICAICPGPRSSS